MGQHRLIHSRSMSLTVFCIHSNLVRMNALCRQSCTILNRIPTTEIIYLIFHCHRPINSLLHFFIICYEKGGISCSLVRVEPCCNGIMEKMDEN